MSDIPLIVHELNGGKILSVNLIINGIKSLFLFDTGSSISIVDERKLDNLLIYDKNQSYKISGISKDIQSHNIIVDKIEIGDVDINKVTLQTLDLIDINNTFSTNYLSTVDGILGCDIIFDIVSNIDIENKLIKIKKNTI